MLKWSWLLAVALAVAGAGAAEGARILAVISFPAPSHLIVFTAMTRTLAERGHQVTLVTPTDRNSKLLPKHNHVIVPVIDDAMMEKKKSSIEKMMTGKNGNFITGMINFFKWGPELVRTTLEHPEFKAEVLKPGQKYDLVITESFFLQEAMVALGHKFNCSVVAVNPFGVSQEINDIMGNPINPSFIPNLFMGFPDKMTFVQRAANLALATFMRLAYWYYQIPMQQKLVDEFFPEAPPLTELLRHQLALTIVNNHFSLSYPVPMAPGVIEVGGMHISAKPKPLPADLQELMDSAKEGVVYFSMGSNLVMEFLPSEKMHAIFHALGSIKQRVLMKWDGPVPAEGVPKNIKILDWAPQSDLLAHPNLKAFVTHGGLLSTQESVYRGVPMVGIPVFGDQEFNMRNAAQKGFAVKVDFADLTKEKLSAALREVVENPRFKEQVSLLSRLFRSVPQPPADLAAFWVEHVLQHGGEHLRPGSVDLPLYQLLLLDVLAVAMLPVLLLVLMVRSLCRCICGRRKTDLDQDKKNKKE